MKRRYFAHIAFLSFLLILSNFFPSKGAASANSETLKGMLAGGADEASLCDSVKHAMGEGIKTKEVVKTAVEMGHNPCFVVKCAVVSGGSLEEIIDGASEAGVTPDVVSRCCMDAGAEGGDVATDLARVCYGLGYSDPPQTQTLTMPDIPAEPPVISPHTF